MELAEDQLILSAKSQRTLSIDGANSNEVPVSQLHANKTVAAGSVFFHDCQHASEASLSLLRHVGNCGKTLGRRGKIRYEKKFRKRITAVRVLVRFPQVEEFLRNNQLNLSTLLEISSLLKAENADELFERVLGKTKREVERIALEYRSPAENKPKDSIRRVRTAKKSVKSAAAVDLPLFTAKPDKTNVTSPGASCDEVLVEEQVRVSFSAGADLAEKIEKAQELLSGKFGTKASLEAVFNLALDALIKAKCPKEKEKRREARQAKASKGDSKPKSSQSSVSRYIPAEIESAVRKRDGHCCSYVGPTGKRCGSTWQLELHHIRPFSIGGEHSVENLALRCRTHNLLEAQQVFGREKIDQFVRLC